MKEKPKKITLSKLIAEADQKKAKDNETKELYVKSLDGTITIRKPDRSLCLDALDMGAQEGDPYVVLECVIEPNLKDAELAKAYECVTPLEVVDVVFEPGEVSLIAQEAVKMAGYGSNSVKAVDDLKN